MWQIDRKENTSSKQQAFAPRAGYTLLELLLALLLTVLVSGLIGMLLQLYYRSSDISQAEVQQAQVARNLLRMIGDDLRSVVRYQEFDDATLTAVLGTGAGGDSGGASGGDAAAGDTTGGASGTGSSSSVGTGGASDASAGIGGPTQSGTGGATTSGSSSMGSDSSGAASSMMSEGDGSSTTSNLAGSTTPPPTPGLYGNQFELLIDVSRLPRPDQYFALQNNIMDTQLSDVPSDIKSVCYYVQASGMTDGVQDPLQNGSLTGIAMETPKVTATSGGGLVRRQLDRSITQWANEQGQSDRLSRTGELLAPEVVSLEFSYFDGTEWLTQWDSSQQKLPMIVRVQLAMQDPRIASQNPLPAGNPISSLGADQIQSYGVRVYELLVAIPGAQLLQSEGTDSGMQSLGL